MATKPSPENTRIPPASSLDVPALYDTWKLGKADPAYPGYFEITRNGVVFGTARASILAYCEGQLYAYGRDKAWYRVSGSAWVKTITIPCDTPPVEEPPPPVGGAGLNVVIDVVQQGSETIIPFTIPNDGFYIMWARVLALDAARDSYFVGADGGAEDIFDVAEGSWSSSWQWRRVCGRGGSTTPASVDPRLFALAKGNHSVKFRVRETGVQLNAIFITDDPLRTPPGGSIPIPPPDDEPPPPPPPDDGQIPPPTGTPPVGSGSAPSSGVFVAPGVDGTGTITNPMSLKAALTQPGKVSPGQTVWLRGSDYFWYEDVTLASNSDRIVVASYPGEWARVRGHLWLKTTNIDFRNFEVIGNDSKRTSTYDKSYTPPDLKLGGIDLQEVGHHTRLINLVVHDGNNNGIGVWGALVPGTEIYGCLVFNCGWFGSDRPHGHGAYIQNLQTSPVVPFEECIFFNNFVYGIQSYGSGDIVNRLLLRGNIFGRSGTQGSQPVLYLGGGLPATDLVLDDNHSISRAVIGDTYGSKGNNNIALNRNIFFSMDFNYWQSVTGRDNRIYEIVGENTIPNAPSRLDRLTNIVGGPPPTSGLDIFVRPNKYEQGRANIAVYNWSKTPTVQANLSTILNSGQGYEIRDAYDFLGVPVVSGVYDGNPVTLPMTGLKVGAGIGIPTQPHTAPLFAAFVVIRTS